MAAGRYARALFEIAILVHKDVEIQRELEALSSALEKAPEVWKFLNSPQFTAGNKIKILGRMYSKRGGNISPSADSRHQGVGGQASLGEHEVLLNFLAVLLEKGRFVLLHEITESFKRIADKARGIGMAQVRSAVPLDPRAEALITARLEKIAGYRIRVEKMVDPKLIGGVSVKIRNKILDGTVQHRLQEFRKELTKIRNV